MSPFNDYQAQAASMLRTSAQYNVDAPLYPGAVQVRIDKLARALEAEDKKEEDMLRLIATELGIEWPWS